MQDVVRLTGRVGGLAAMKRLAPPADEALLPGAATVPGLPANQQGSNFQELNQL